MIDERLLERYIIRVMKTFSPVDKKPTVSQEAIDKTMGDMIDAAKKSAVEYANRKGNTRKKIDEMRLLTREGR